MREVDCLIIGAGPTGLTLGIGLLRLGKTVLIVEKHRAGLGFSKAILVSSDSLQALTDYGVAKKIQLAGIPLDGLSFFVDELLTSCAQFDTGKPNHPFILPQEATEKCLKDSYLDLGGDICLGMSFSSEANVFDSVGSSQESLFIQLHQKDSPDSVTTVKCNYLFGCDGMHSSVRKSLNIAYPGRAVPEQVNFIFDVEVECWPFDTLLTMWFASADSGIMMKISSDPLVARIVGTTEASAQRLLQKLRVKRVVWESTYYSNYRLAESYGRGNVWLAGDACHVHSPLGGRGMNTGIADAIALTHAVQTGDFASYEATRRPAAQSWVYFNYILSVVSMSQSSIFHVVRFVVSLIMRLLAWMMGPNFAVVAFQKMTTSVVQRKIESEQEKVLRRDRRSE